jgi:hypothetical protein
MPPIAWVSLLLLVGPVPAGPAVESAAGNYETLAKGAVRTHDVATLLAPFVDHCDSEKRDLDRTRCRAVLGYLRRTLPQQTFAVGTEDPAAIAVSAYDASVKGYHVALAGCIACTKPLSFGRSGEPRFVTVKVPEKDKAGEPLAKAVPVSRSTFGFDSLAEARHWLDSERPFMRAEFLFQPQAAEADWTFGERHGVALKLVGARVYNRCTGQVLMSSPPSTGVAERGPRDAACSAGSTARVAQVVPPEDLPLQLSQVSIGEAMDHIRAQVFACYQKYRAPGRLELTYVVASNGTVQSVVMGSAFAGTATGLCALEAAKDARFTQFRMERQKFTYTFFLRD